MPTDFGLSALIILINKNLPFCFIIGFVFVKQRYLSNKGSPFGRAPAIAGERAFYVKLSILSTIILSIIWQTPLKFSSISLLEKRKT